MKVTLYIRGTKPGRVKMWTRLEEEPNYGDTPRIISVGQDIGAELDAIIRRCEGAGAVAPPQKKEDNR